MAVLALPQANVERRRMKSVRHFLRDPKAQIASFVLGIYIVCALVGPQISPHGENDQDLSHSLEAPSIQHPFGTDQLGRDLLSRTIYGARVSVTIGLLAVALAIAVGLPLGLVSGYFGGWLDAVVMRFVDAWMSFPALILVLSIVAILGSSLLNVMIAIGLASFPVFARLIRAQTISNKETDFVLAARSLGATTYRILWRHILPNSIQPVVVQASLLIGGAVLAEAGLSFLGLGARPPTATWGLIISEGFPVVRLSPWPTVFPGVLIFLFVLSANFMGDRLRDTLDPRLRGKI
ncbi:MAG: ABC transporter permease [Dehalococcoidia bacterium]